VSDTKNPRESMHQFGFDHGLGFQVADETIKMMRQVAPELNRMSRDRIGTEIMKAMEQSRRPSRFFEVLRDCGALAVIWPELDRATVTPAGPPEHHAESAYMFEE
jgi:tRNA nucleotidyltransferase (CCA-adding enzyme)